MCHRGRMWPALASTVYCVSKVKCANNIQHAKNCDYLPSQSTMLLTVDWEHVPPFSLPQTNPPPKKARENFQQCKFLD